MAGEELMETQKQWGGATIGDGVNQSAGVNEMEAR
jgi:hypothetical protein